ncbi:MAG: Signal transduction response regulator [Anaerolineae bacterium]|jgi:two-component system cell cycle response regulator DivK|nr:MAG: Signal transduction response regulator [Anaerolineae bacterium]
MEISKSPLILYVEDNIDNRVLVRRILEADGFRVEEASSGHEAFEKLKTITPDLILMDINLPEVDGYTLTTTLKAQLTPNIPIIALTANVMKGDREKTLQAGCDGYIQKPIDVDALPSQVRSYLSSKTKG